MDVKRGYKQTEVGVIPADWEVSPLENFTSFISYGFTNPMPASESGVYMITAKDINHGRIQFDTARCTTKEAYSTLLTAKSRPKKGDLLLTKDGTLGRLALVDDRTVCINQSVAILRPNPKVNPRFLKGLLEAPEYQARMLEDAGGSTIKHIYITIVNHMPVAVPPAKAEQEAIAEALSDTDALIESLEQLLTKKRQLKQGAMQELLTGKKRLPRFSGKWEVKRLEELAVIRSGGTPSTTQAQFWDGGIPWCTPTDITALNGHKYLIATNRTISHLGLKSSSAEVIPANSVVMTSRATIGECAINRMPATTNQGFKNFVPSENVDVNFLYYLLLMQRQGFIRLCGGSTFLEIRKSQLATFEVRVPSTRAEQTAIAAILSDMDAEIAALEAKLSKARQIKQGMMQELLTGRIRLV
jgi:type I restriction enzyme S subunit